MLWRAAVEEAEAAGATVLVTRCVEAEMPIAFGGLADLLGESLPEVAEELPEPQRAALAAAVGLETPQDESPDRIALPRAFTAALRVLSVRAPVLIAVDDVQWIDPPSRRVLAFAIRRLTEAPVGVLLTQRGADTGSSLDLLQGVEERFEEIRLGPLSVDAVHQLVRSRLGLRMPRPALTRVHQASGGNPMFALELARTAGGKKSDVSGPLPNPLSLEELVRDRVLEYSNGIRPLLEVVAAVERATPALLARTVDDADELLDAAIAAGAVTLGDDEVVRFAHPLLTAAIYAELPPARRRALHARIAASMHEPEERARHLALSAAEPDAVAARLLEAVAARARARGAPDAAAGLAQQAVRLTPHDDVADRDARVLGMASHLADAGQVANAAACLDELLATGLAGPQRAQACLARFQVEPDIEARGRLVADALEHAGDDAGLRARVLLLTSQYRLNREENRASLMLARQALADAERADEPALVANALATVAARAFLLGHPEPAHFERAIALEDEHGILPRETSPRVLFAEELLCRGDLPGARELLTAAFDATISSGSQHSRVVIRLAEVELGAGNWELAERHLDQAWELAFDGGDRFVECWVRGLRAALASLRGRVDEARELARQGIADSEAVHWPFLAAENQWILGFLELSLGQPGPAWELLADVTQRSDLPLAPPIADGIEALVGLGRVAEAEKILAQFERRLPVGNAAAAALRCRGLVLLARGEAEKARAAAAESAAGFETAGFPLERGRALLVAGEALRRLGERRRAAEQLEVAQAIFAGLGATLWLERVEQELRRAQPRPRRDRGLTGAERRVASLVAEGRMNREVAAQLFTTVGTVEAHLTRIYRKLDVRTRTELARGVAEGRLDLEER